MKTLRVSFVWDWLPEYYQSVTWQDGLAAALVELGKRGHSIQILCDSKDENIIHNPLFDIQATSDILHRVALFKPDVILHWGDLTRPNAPLTRKLGIPQALCFAGGDTNAQNINEFDHVFVESEVYKPAFMRRGTPVSTAFGTNTDLFKPIEGQPKLYDTIFPATFALWKRHDLYAKAVKDLQAVACGYIYGDHEQECWQTCLDNGVMIMPHVSAEVLRYLYAASYVCVIPSQSNGGSQRTVLEAMAMNIPVVVCDSDKFDFAEGLVFESAPLVEDLRLNIERALGIATAVPVNTRDYVLNNWSHIQYADALEKGLRSIA